MKILIVDDEAMTRRMAQMILEKAGNDCLMADSGMAALEILKQEKVDLVLMDVEMPQMSGLQTLEEIRKSDWGREQKVVLMSGTIDEAVQNAKQNQGVIDCMQKPFKVPDLQGMLEKVNN